MVFWCSEYLSWEDWCFGVSVDCLLGLTRLNCILFWIGKNKNKVLEDFVKNFFWKVCCLKIGNLGVWSPSSLVNPEVTNSYTSVDRSLLTSQPHILKKGNFSGCSKRAYIAALRQAKFYPCQQAAEATEGSTSCTAAGMKLKVGRRSTRAAVHEILFYPSWTAAVPQ